MSMNLSFGEELTGGGEILLFVEDRPSKRRDYVSDFGLLWGSTDL